GNGVVIAYDRAEFLKATYVKKLYFHVNPGGGPPSVAGDTASIRVGASALFMRAVLPASPVIAVATDPVSDTDPRTSTYRLEVSDAAAGTTLEALNVFAALPASTATMPSSTRLRATEGAMAGAMVADGADQRIALFASDGKPQAIVTYTADY